MDFQARYAIVLQCRACGAPFTTMALDKKVTRKQVARPSGGTSHDAKYPLVRVRFSSPAEKETAEENAERCGYPKLAGFMKKLALGHSPPSVFDSQVILEIASLSGDLGKIGGLIKQELGELRKGRTDPALTSGLSAQLDALATTRRKIALLILSLDSKME